MRRQSLLYRAASPRDRVDLLSAVIVLAVMAYVLGVALFGRVRGQDAPTISPDPEQTALAERP